MGITAILNMAEELDVIFPAATSGVEPIQYKKIPVPGKRFTILLNIHFLPRRSLDPPTINYSFILSHPQFFV